MQKQIFILLENIVDVHVMDYYINYNWQTNNFKKEHYSFIY
jgi:hypothetical protein